MPNKQNLHIHTSYADGKDTPEEIIAEAIKKGACAVALALLLYKNYKATAATPAEA